MIVWVSRNEILLDGIATPLISKELLIKNKSKTGREKDQMDVRELLRLEAIVIFT